jgi:hypothetical protein
VLSERRRLLQMAKNADPTLAGVFPD